MNLDLTKAQEMVQQSAVRFVTKECPFSLVKELEDSADSYSPKLWQKMKALGWLELLIPESYGGLGSEFMDLVLIQEALGSQAVPSPFFSTVVVGGLTILEGGSESQRKDLLSLVAGGNLILALAQYEEQGSYLKSGIQMTAEEQEDHYLLNGIKLFVTDANIAHKLIVAAREHSEDEGLTLFLVDTDMPGLTISKLRSIAKDNTCVVTFNNVRVPKKNILGNAGTGWAVLERVHQKASVARSAEMIGACRTCIDMTSEYAKQRIQYEKPIGGNQAIQHYLANMLIGYDTVHEYLYRVVCMIDNGEDVGLEASILKSRVNENFKYISERSIHIHGAIGTTREYDIALFYRRAKSWEYACGDTDYHQERIMQYCEHEMPGY